LYTIAQQLTANNRRRKDLYTLPHADKALLDSIGYRCKLQEIDAAILANADFFHKIVANPEIFGHDMDMVTEEDGGIEKDVALGGSERPLRQSLGFHGRGRAIRSVHRFQALLLLASFQVTANPVRIVTRTAVPTM